MEATFGPGKMPLNQHVLPSFLIVSTSRTSEIHKIELVCGGHEAFLRLIFMAESQAFVKVNGSIGSKSCQEGHAELVDEHPPAFTGGGGSQGAADGFVFFLNSKLAYFLGRFGTPSENLVVNLRPICGPELLHLQIRSLKSGLIELSHATFPAPWSTFHVR